MIRVVSRIVEEAKKDVVIIRVGNTSLIFYPTPEGRIKLNGKFNRFAQVWDPHENWVSDKEFAAACKQAAAIFKRFRK